jgi:pimeloyl-ACP methyl ester carboxylesterase
VLLLPKDTDGSLEQAFLVGKDFGALPAYDFALQHPDRTCGVVCLGIPFSPVPFAFDTMPEGFYVLRWGVRVPLLLHHHGPLDSPVSGHHHQFVRSLLISAGAWQGRG